jgi:hypothetical protein
MQHIVKSDFSGSQATRLKSYPEWVAQASRLCFMWCALRALQGFESPPGFFITLPSVGK